MNDCVSYIESHCLSHVLVFLLFVYVNCVHLSMQFGDNIWHFLFHFRETARVLISTVNDLINASSVSI